MPEPSRRRLPLDITIIVVLASLALTSFSLVAVCCFTMLYERDEISGYGHTAIYAADFFACGLFLTWVARWKLKRVLRR